MAAQVKVYTTVEEYLALDRQAETYDLNATVRLPSVDCQLALADVYAKVEFTAAS